MESILPTMKTKLPLPTAVTLAESILTALTPGCSRIAIAGSVRREKPEIGDIEIVCIPRVTGHDLFGVPQYSLETLNDLIALQNWGGNPAGDHYRQYDLGPCALDLFITTPECWGVIFTLRTGDADFSRLAVTQRNKGGFLPSNLNVKHGRVWMHGTALETPEETDFLRILGFGEIEPKYRSQNALYNTPRTQQKGP
jgi:DNA polymerase/3'-5' exonuclease PolX